MSIQNIQRITVNFDPPKHSDSIDEIESKSYNLFQSLNPYTDQLNRLSDQVNGTVSDINAKKTDFDSKYLSTNGRLAQSEQSADSVNNRMASIEMLLQNQLPGLDVAAGEQVLAEISLAMIEQMSRYLALQEVVEEQGEKIRILTSRLEILEN